MEANLHIRITLAYCDPKGFVCAAQQLLGNGHLAWPSTHAGCKCLCGEWVHGAIYTERVEQNGMTVISPGFQESDMRMVTFRRTAEC